MAEITKWPKGMVEIQPTLRLNNDGFHLPCEIRNGQAKTPGPPDICWWPLTSNPSIINI